jgi:hypothetical protein
MELITPMELFSMETDLMPTGIAVLIQYPKKLHMKADQSPCRMNMEQ